MSLHVDYILYIEDLPADCVKDCSAVGDVSEAVDYWQSELGLTVNRERTIGCLYGYGNKERHELESMSNEELAKQVLFYACGDFNEWDGTESSPCGSDLFVLE